MPHRPLTDEGYRVYGCLMTLTSNKKVVRYLDESAEGKALLESLYQLRDNQEFLSRFRVED